MKKGQKDFNAELEKDREGLESNLKAAEQKVEQALEEQKNADDEFERLKVNFNNQRSDDGKKLKKAKKFDTADASLKQAREEVAACTIALRDFDQARKNYRTRMGADWCSEVKRKNAAKKTAKETVKETVDALVAQQLTKQAETNWQNEEKAAAAVKEIKEAIENYQKHLSGADTYNFLGCLPILKRRTMFFERFVLKHGETKLGKGDLARDSIEVLDGKKVASQKIEWIKNKLLAGDNNTKLTKSRDRWFWKAPQKSHGAVLVENIERIIKDKCKKL